jgi:hypothetical protein
LAIYGHEDLACDLPTNAAEIVAIDRAGNLVQEYAQQLVWPDLNLKVTFCRGRPPIPSDLDPTVNNVVDHVVEHGLFLDWSNKKSKTN